MIFLTIGSQEPFDRLIKAMDTLAPLLESSIIAQTMETGLQIKNMKCLSFIPPETFKAYCEEAELIVAHAGMGCIITALELQKPIVVLPRLKKFGETRNDHQLATARKLESLDLIRVAYHESELFQKISETLEERFVPSMRLDCKASQSLLSSIRNFIEQ